MFRNFHVDPRNSWLRLDEKLGDFPLVVDAANGAMSGIAAEVFGVLHGGPVIEVNHDTESGDVKPQEWCGRPRGRARDPSLRPPLRRARRRP